MKYQSLFTQIFLIFQNVAAILSRMTLVSKEHKQAEMKTFQVSKFSGQNPTIFGQLGSNTDSHTCINFQKSGNRLSDHKGPEI